MVFFWAFSLSFVPIFFVVRHFEEIGAFDSIGIWYTVYVTSTFSGPLALVVAVLALLVRSRTS